MIKNAALFLVLIGLFVGIAIYSHKQTQKIEQPAPDVVAEQVVENATSEMPKPEATVETAETAEVAEDTENRLPTPINISNPKPKSFASDIEALEAYHLCHQHEYELQACIDKLADYHSHGFIIQVADGDAEPYLTLPLADESKISIHYKTANVLLGDIAELKKAAKSGTLGDEMQKLFAAEITLLTPSE